jgi:hypothetical protein
MKLLLREFVGLHVYKSIFINIYLPVLLKSLVVPILDQSTTKSVVSAKDYNSENKSLIVFKLSSNMIRCSSLLQYDFEAKIKQLNILFKECILLC